jgi:polyisoprenoid-binding protein YceI
LARFALRRHVAALGATGPVALGSSNRNNNDHDWETVLMLRPALAAFAAASLLAGAVLAQPAAMPGPSMSPADLPAGHYVSDEHHTAMIFRVHHMGMTYSTFRMNGVKASFDYDPASPTASKVTASMDANGFDQGDPKISAQFAKEFLGADKTPMITFASTSIKAGAGNKGTMTGDLTLLGVTKPVTLDVTFDGSRPASNFGPPRAGFSAHGTVTRSNFGPLAMPAAMVGDDVDVTLEIEFTKAS